MIILWRATGATGEDWFVSTQFSNTTLSNPKAHLIEDDLAELRKMSLEERGRLIVLACRAADAILAGRRESGLPDEQPAPWPASTLALLKKHANAHRKG